VVVMSGVPHNQLIVVQPQHSKIQDSVILSALEHKRHSGCRLRLSCIVELVLGRARLFAHHDHVTGWIMRTLTR